VNYPRSLGFINFAALVTAKVLSKHASEVILIERGKFDQFKSIPNHAPQVHILLGRGVQTLSKIFPEFSKEN
jgi:hypothetical protein